METYQAVYFDKEEVEKRIQFVSKEEEKGPNNTTKWCISYSKMPIAYTAYMCWCWDYYGEFFTNMLFQINLFHTWAHRPTYANANFYIQCQIEFLIAAMHKRIINESIRRQQHKLFEKLHTCEAEKVPVTQFNDLRKMSVMIKEILKASGPNKPCHPTSPAPPKFPYNSYIVYECQRHLIKKMEHVCRKSKKWKLEKGLALKTVY